MQTSSPICAEIGEALAKGNHIFVYGAIDDDVLHRGTRMTLLRFGEQILGQGFTVVVRLSPVDGLAVVSNRSDIEIDTGANSNPYEVIHDLALRADVTVLVIISDVGLLLRDAARGDNEDNFHLALVQDAMRNAPRSEPIGTSFLLLNAAEEIPAEVRTGVSRLTAISRGKPNDAERLAVLRHEIGSSNGATTLPTSEVRSVEKILVGLTDGLTLREVGNLGRYSRLRGLPVSDARHLVSTFRYGPRPDRWARVREDLPSIRAVIAERIVGQREAVEAVVDGLAAASLGLNLRPDDAFDDGPRALFHFVGPSGTGKTEVGKTLGEAVFGSADRVVIINCGDLVEAHSVARLIGAPPGYVGYSEGSGVLIDALQQHGPCLVLIFDEIEKANVNVLKVLLRLLDDGCLTDARGRVHYFGESVIVLTSNTGSAELLRSAAGKPTSTTTPAAHLSQLDPDAVRILFRDQVREHYAIERGMPEFVNRIYDVTHIFQPVQPEDVAAITEKTVRAARFTNGPKLEVDVTSAVAAVHEAFADARHAELGARFIKNMVRSQLRAVAGHVVLTGNADAGLVTVQFVGVSTTEVSIDGRPPVTVSTASPMTTSPTIPIRELASGGD